MDIRYGQASDFGWLQEHDKHANPEWISRCLHHGEYILAADEQDRKGFLRFSMFWGNIPYMDLIWVLKNFRQHGVGSGLFSFWEKEMKKRGTMSEGIILHLQNGFSETVINQCVAMMTKLSFRKQRP